MGKTWRDRRSLIRRRAAYLSFLKEFCDSTEGQGTCERKWLERMRGRLGYCAQLSRWAAVFLTEIDAAMFPPGCGMTPPHRCKLTAEMMADIKTFWMRFLAEKDAPWLVLRQWSTLPKEEAIAFTHFVSSSDASGRWGAGGVTEWEDLQRQWAPVERPLHINVKELVAAADTAVARMSRYAGGRLIMELDNKGAVGYVNRGTAGVPEARPILRALGAAALAYNVEVRAMWRCGEAMGPIGTDPNSRGKAPETARQLPRVWQA